MKDTIDMAREAGGREVDKDDPQCCIGSMAFDEHELKVFAELVRADEREQGQKWFDAVTAQHKQEILAEREACAKVCDEEYFAYVAADAIRNRGNT